MTGSLQVKKGAYYAVINLYTLDGKRKQKWVSTGVPALGNKQAGGQQGPAPYFRPLRERRGVGIRGDLVR